MLLRRMVVLVDCAMSYVTNGGRWWYLVGSRSHNCSLRRLVASASEFRLCLVDAITFSSKGGKSWVCGQIGMVKVRVHEAH